MYNKSMKVGIYTNVHKDVNLTVTLKLIGSFSSHGILCYVHDNLKDKIFRLPKHLLYLLQMYIHDVPNSHLFLLKL